MPDIISYNIRYGISDDMVQVRKGLAQTILNGREGLSYAYPRLRAKYLCILRTYDMLHIQVCINLNKHDHSTSAPCNFPASLSSHLTYFQHELLSTKATDLKEETIKQLLKYKKTHGGKYVVLNRCCDVARSFDRESWPSVYREVWEVGCAPHYIKPKTFHNSCMVLDNLSFYGRTNILYMYKHLWAHISVSGRALEPDLTIFGPLKHVRQAKPDDGLTNETTQLCCLVFWEGFNLGMIKPKKLCPMNS